MTAKTYFILPIAALLSACSGVGYSNGNDTSFERQGVASCNASSIVAVGTSTDPVRCGPQVQSLR
jgi:hypothetical protein